MGLGSEYGPGECVLFGRFLKIFARSYFFISSSSSHIAVSPTVASHGDLDIGILVLVRPGNLLPPKLDTEIADEISGVNFLELVVAT